MSLNFTFLKDYWPDFAKTMELAENYIWTDPSSSMNKTGLFVECLVHEILKIEQIPEPEQISENTSANRIKLLRKEGLLPYEVNQWMHQIRKSRNDSVHKGKGTFDEALEKVGFAYHIATWFMKVYGNSNYIEKPFVEPKQEREIDYSELVLNQKKRLAEQEALIEQLKKEREAKNQITPQAELTKQERQTVSAAAIINTKLTEDQTRELIDEQLRKVGWDVDTKNIRYSKGTRPQKGKNLAIAEWPIKATKVKDDRADYALFIGENLVGIVEAKAYEKSVYAIIDNQCHEYARNIKDEDLKYCTQTYGNYKVPFVFATNGRPYIKQIETESGIWFHDLRNQNNIPIGLQGWFSPESLLIKLKQDIGEAESNLENLPYDFLRDPDGLNFRYYQTQAVESVEKAIINGQKQILLAMATGTGKTRTILGMVYRFLKTNRFNRILFLVDRTALGEQALDTFNDVKLEDLQPLNKIYNINKLDDIELASETRVQVATVQGMIARIMNNDKERIPSVGDFDCIIIDEAHRGYTLDKELTDAELLFRDQNDFVSKYKKVIEYFDAVRIGLTATPALHTTKIFGNPVYTYTYREAVIDGYLVDYDAPHIIKTELNQQGIHHKKGETLARFNPVTKELLNPEELEDEIDFDVEDFNKNVITPSFNKVVLEELSKYIDPEGEEKTIIFAVNDRHADEIVKQLREIYAAQDISSAAIEKITCAIGDRQRIQNAIKRFKNEHFPTIAVTVDLLSTGIDVHEVTKIVFIRRIKSRILYEQMLGRATRLCPKINKTHFDIYDAVDLYSYLEDLSSMKPVVSNPAVTFDELLSGYSNVKDIEHIQAINEQIIAKLQRTKHHMDESQENYFKIVSNFESVDEFISKLKEAKNNSVEDCMNFIKHNKAAFNAFKMQKNSENYIFVSNKVDSVHEVSRGYGSGEKPEEYLEGFKNYIKENRGKIEALEIVCTRPIDLKIEDLRKLTLTLDANGFSKTRLNTAIKTLTKEECTADIISIVRRYAIGSPLISHEERIRNAVKKLCKAHEFTAGEKKWIERIEKYLINESVLNIKTFDEYSAWKIQGGFNKVNKIFNNALAALVYELNTYLYDDKTA